MAHSGCGLPALVVSVGVAQLRLNVVIDVHLDVAVLFFAVVFLLASSILALRLQLDVFLVRGRCLVAIAFLLLDVYDGQVQHRYLYLILHFNVLLFIVQVELVFAALVQLVVLFLKLGCLLAELRRLLEQLQEGALPVVALAEFNLQLL